jgi:hypothetical protein
MAEDILTAAEAEHGYTIAMTAFEEYQWMAADMIMVAASLGPCALA